MVPYPSMPSRGRRSQFMPMLGDEAKSPRYFSDKNEWISRGSMMITGNDEEPLTFDKPFSKIQPSRKNRWLI